MLMRCKHCGLEINNYNGKLYLYEHHNGYIGCWMANGDERFKGFKATLITKEEIVKRILDKIDEIA